MMLSLTTDAFGKCFILEAKRNSRFVEFLTPSDSEFVRQQNSEKRRCHLQFVEFLLCTGGFSVPVKNSIRGAPFVLLFDRFWSDWVALVTKTVYQCGQTTTMAFNPLSGIEPKSGDVNWKIEIIPRTRNLLGRCCSSFPLGHCVFRQKRAIPKVLGEGKYCLMNNIP